VDRRIFLYLCGWESFEFKNNVVLKHYNIPRHYNSKQKVKHNCDGALRREKVLALLIDVSHSRVSSENNRIIVPLHGGQVIVFLTRKENFFPMVNS
jgi:hypothetical protein